MGHQVPTAREPRSPLTPRPDLTVRGARPDPLHVLVIIDSLTAGGAEMLLSDFAAGAADLRLRVSVAYVAELDGSPAAARLRRFGVEPVQVDYHGLLHPSTFASMRRHIRETAPDVVHTHLDYADAVGGLAARSLGVPSVSTIHVMEWHARSLRDRVRKRLMESARRRSAKVVVAVSDASREAMIAAGIERPERIVTIRNGVEALRRPGAGEAVRAELGIESGELVIAQIAVLRRGKGHDATVGAFTRLRDQGLRARLLLVGDGPDREVVERAIEPLGTAAIALGHRDDVMAVLDASDVVVSPSVVDAFPTVLLEAMAAGVPIVATAVGGIPEIVVNDETGLLVSAPADLDELAGALGLVLEDSALRARLGRAGRTRYEREFTAASWVGRMRELYRDLLGERDQVTQGSGG